MLSACTDSSVSQVPQYPEVDSPSAQLLLAKCSGCHAAPHPRVHSAAMWPSVVHRMQMQIQLRAMAPLTDDEMTMLIDYLQANAGAEGN